MKKKSRVFLIFIIALIIIGAICLIFYFKEKEIAETSNSEVVVTYWTHNDVNRNALEDKLIKQFEEENPNIKVEVKRFSSSELFSIVPTSIKIKSNTPTLVCLQSDYLIPILNEESFVPVDYEIFGYENKEGLINEYIPSSLDEVIYHDELYGIPMERTSWCLFINKNKFREVGLDPDKDWPKTWEEMVEISQKFVKHNEGILEERGFDFRYPYYLGFLVPMVEQLGGSIIDSTGHFDLFNENAWKEVINYFKNWGPTGLYLGSPTLTNSRYLFNSEEIAMTISGYYQIKRLASENPEFYQSGEWMVVPFPQFENAKNRVSSAHYSFYWTVNGNSSKEEQEAAWKLVKYFSEHEIEYLEQVGLIMPKKSIEEYSTTIDSDALSVFLDDMHYSKPIVSTHKAGKVRNFLTNIFNEIILSGIETDKAIVRLRVGLREMNL